MCVYVYVSACETPLAGIDRGQVKGGNKGEGKAGERSKGVKPGEQGEVDVCLGVIGFQGGGLTYLACRQPCLSTPTCIMYASACVISKQSK